MTDEVLESIKKMNTELTAMFKDYKGMGESYKTMQGQVSDLSKKLDETIKSYDGELVALKTGIISAPPKGAGSISPEMKGMIDYLNTGENKAAAVSTVANPTTGGYVVPNTFIAQVIPKLRDSDNIRANAEVIPVNGMVADLPYEIDEGETIWVGENQTRSADGSGTIGLAHIPVNEVISKIRVSKRLLMSSAIDIENYLVSSLTNKMGRDTEAAFVSGDGFQKPYGVFTDPTVSTVASGNASALTANGIIDLVGALTSAADANAKFYGGRGALAAIMKLRDDKNPGLWAPPAGAGLPSTVMGYPYMVCPSAPAVSAGTKPLILGDMYSAYKIVQGQSMTMERDTLTGADIGQVIIRFSSYLGGQCIMPSSIVAQSVGAS